VHVLHGAQRRARREPRDSVCPAGDGHHASAIDARKAIDSEIDIEVCGTTFSSGAFWCKFAQIIGVGKPPPWASRYHHGRAGIPPRIRTRRQARSHFIGEWLKRSPSGEQGLDYDQIGERLKCNPSNAYKLVVKAMDRIIAEPAKRVLDLELRRLDILQTSIFIDASQGDLAAQAMYLRLADHRAKLLGLYPKEPQMHLNVGGDGPSEFKINFVLPPPREEVCPPPPVDVTPQGPADYSRPAYRPHRKGRGRHSGRCGNSRMASPG
jgi:hypothetical protein